MTLQKLLQSMFRFPLFTPARRAWMWAESNAARVRASSHHLRPGGPVRRGPARSRQGVELRREAVHDFGGEIAKTADASSESIARRRVELRSPDRGLERVGAPGGEPSDRPGKRIPASGGAEARIAVPDTVEAAVR